MKRGGKALLVLAAVVALAFASASWLGVGCPIKAVFGIGCPGCGLSRAAACLLRGDFAGALYHNPMIYLLPPVILYVLFGKKPLLGSKARERILLWGVIAVWLVLYAVRLCLHHPDLF